MKLTSTTMFSGAGLMDIAINAAGFRTVQAIECDKRIAVEFANNFPDVKLFNQRVEAIAPESLEPTHHVHGSPSCQRSSVASNGTESTEKDIKPALAFLKIIQSMHERSGGTMPRYVTLENVWQYRNFESFQLIVEGLQALGYCVGYQLCDAADFGTPQHRKRLWLRAILPQYVSSVGQMSLFGDRSILPVEGNHRWVGWYEALEDLLPDLPDGKLADWQIKRLPQSIKESLLVKGENSKSNGKPWHQKKEPSFTLSTSASLKAILIDVRNVRRTLTQIASPDPSFTIQASHCSPTKMPRAVLLDGRNKRNTSTAEGDRPSFTVLATVSKGYPNAFLVQRVGAKGGDRPLMSVDSDKPSFTLRALGHDNHWHQADALIEGCVKTLTPEALWRLQVYGSEFNYQWKTSSNATKCRGIGNGVAYLNALAIMQSLLG